MSTPVPLACRCDFPATCERTGECYKLRVAGVLGMVPTFAPTPPVPPTTSAPVDPTGEQGRGGPR